MEEEKNVVNEEQKKEVTEKKKGNGSTIIILLLVLACVGLGGYVVYDKVLSPKTSETEEKEKGNSSEKEKEETKSSDEKEVTFTDSELEKYVNYISPASIGPSAKIYNVDSVVASKLSAREKIEHIGKNLINEKLISDSNTYPHNDRFLEKDVKEYVENVYGAGTYEAATFNLGCADYTLSNDGYYREAENGGCGGTTATIVKNDVISYKATKNKLEITTAYVFLEGATTLYKDFEKKEELGKYTGEQIPNTVENADKREKTIDSYLSDYIKTNKDKLYQIKYTFESTDGTHYYFKELTNTKK